MTRPTPRDLGALALLALGLAAMVGDAAGWLPLKGVALATGASPLPKVFSAVDGYETYAARFTLLADGAGGEEIAVPLTPELASRLRGPYNRRNVYGAALSYAPRLPPELWQPVYCYGLAPDGPLRRELGLPGDASRVRVRIESATRGSGEAWLLEARCSG